MGLSIVKRTQFARALRSRPFALLWIGQTISTLGNGAFTVALAWEVLLLTGSATAMGVVVVSQSIPLIFFLLLGGVASDWFSRRLLLLFSDLGRGIILLLIAILGWAHLLQLWHLIALSFCFGLIKSFFDPAYQALRPQLVETEARVSANALTGLSRQLGMLLGPLIGVGSIAIIGTEGTFAFDGVTFLASVICLLFLRVPVLAPASPATPHTSRPKLAVSQGIRQVGRGVFEGVGYVMREKWLWISLVVASVGNIGYAASLGVALPKLVYHTYGAGVWLFGAIGTANAVGSIGITLVVGQLKHLHRRGLLAYLALIVYGVALIVFGLPLPPGGEPIVAITAGGMVGLGLAFFDIIWVTIVQEHVPNEKLGRVSSIDTFISFVLTPIGYIAGGGLADAIGPSWVFILGGVLNISVVVVALSVREIRQLK